MMPKPEQANLWSSQEAAIKAEITEAKNTVDLIRMPKPLLDSTRCIRKWKQRLSRRCDPTVGTK
jgi:hypothetical protein